LARKVDRAGNEAAKLIMFTFHLQTQRMPVLQDSWDKSTMGLSVHA